jgi:tetratricopeptide (TPR) repeat protein
MTALQSKRALLGLAVVVAAVVAAILASGLLRGDEPPVGKDTARVTSVAGTGSSTDRLIASFQRRLKDNPEDFSSYVNLANAYLQKVRETGDPSLYAKADDLLDRAEKIEPQNPELFATRGILALARHDFARALEFGERALALNPESARYYGIVGDAQIELGRYEEAIASYQKMIDLRPDFSSYSRVAYARELYGDPEGAIQAMQDVVDAGAPVPENKAWAYVQLGNLRFTTGQLEEAAKDYDLATKTLPNYPPALAGQARIAAARGELEDAAALYQQAFDRMPLAEYAILLGDVYTEMGERQKAAQQYDLVRVIDKLYRANGVNTDLEIALFYADHDMKLQTSLQKARAAYEARPSIHAADVLAWTLYKTGNYEEAQRYSSEALKLGTRDSLKLFHAGMIAKALGHDEQAQKYLQQAIDLNPHFSLLYSNTATAALEDLKEGSDAASKGDK